MLGYLSRRGLWYYFRLQIPKDLRRWFPGAELKISLRTPSRAVARGMARVWLYPSEKLVGKVRGCERRRGAVTDAEIKKLGRSRSSASITKNGGRPPWPR
jgi:hypothetical protein